MKKIILVLVMSLIIGFMSCKKSGQNKKVRKTERKVEGGINISLQLSVKEILIKLSNNSKNVKFYKALDLTDEKHKDSKDSYLDVFVREFEKIADGTKLNSPSIFRNIILAKKINKTDSNDVVKNILQGEIDLSIKASQEVLRIRIDKLGAVLPKVEIVGNSGKIKIELPGVKDTLRIRKLIENKGNLQFWETYNTNEMRDFLIKAQEKSLDLFKDENKVKGKKEKDIINTKNEPTTAKNKSLFTFLSTTGFSTSPIIGYAKVKDTARINTFLRNKEIRVLLKTKYTKFLWDYKSFSKSRELSEIEIKMDVKNPERIALYAMKSNSSNTPSIEGDIISDAKQEFETQGRNSGNPLVLMTMNAVGKRAWEKMTERNIGRAIAIVLDNKVYTAPYVNSVITGGGTIISGGSMTISEAKNLATVIRAGKLPASVKVTKLSLFKN